jgi:delta24(24(1))-sterol reductase
VPFGSLVFLPSHVQANSQKNRFRMMEEGSYMPRPWAQPQLPWGTLVNPTYVQTKQGG